MTILAWLRAAAIAAVLTYPCAARAADRDESHDETDQDTSDSVPVGWHREAQFRRWPLVSGSLGFAVAYLSSVGVAAFVRADNLRPELSDWLFVPVVGPFVVASRFTFRTHSRVPEDGLVIMSDGIADLVLIIDGGIQAASLVLLTYGLASRRPVLVPDQARRFPVLPVPMVFGGRSVGAGVVGTF